MLLTADHSLMLAFDVLPFQVEDTDHIERFIRRYRKLIKCLAPWSVSSGTMIDGYAVAIVFSDDGRGRIVRGVISEKRGDAVNISRLAMMIMMRRGTVDWTMR